MKLKQEDISGFQWLHCVKDFIIFSRYSAWVLYPRFATSGSSFFLVSKIQFLGVVLFLSIYKYTSEGYLHKQRFEINANTDLKAFKLGE